MPRVVLALAAWFFGRIVAALLLGPALLFLFGKIGHGDTDVALNLLHYLLQNLVGGVLFVVVLRPTTLNAGSLAILALAATVFGWLGTFVLSEFPSDIELALLVAANPLGALVGAVVGRSTLPHARAA